jgi:hypothetical protein
MLKGKTEFTVEPRDNWERIESLFNIGPHVLRELCRGNWERIESGG